MRARGGEQLKSLLGRMEETESRLGTFLHLQRTEFPCGFLLSDTSLLQLLSLEGQPGQMQPFLQQCFPGVKEVRFDLVKGQGEAFTAVVGRRDEAMRLVAPVMCGKGAVVSIMLRLHHAIPQSISACLSTLVQAGGGPSEWAPTFLAIVATAVRTCRLVEDAWAEGRHRSKLDHIYLYTLIRLCFIFECWYTSAHMR